MTLQYCAFKHHLKDGIPNSQGQIRPLR